MEEGGSESAISAGRTQELRDLVEEALGGLCARRGGDSTVTVMGVVDHAVVEAGRRFLEKVAPSGVMVPTWPRDRGGLGLSESEGEVVRGIVAEYDIPDLHPFLIGLQIAGPALLAHGTKDQLDRLIDRLIRGQDVWCQLFSEPEAGSDIAGLRTRAIRDGAGWWVSGQKVWSSRAHYAQRGLLLTRTDPNVPKHAGITCFALAFDTPGIRVRPLKQMNGEAHFNEVFFDDVWVPDEDRVGDIGGGWKVAVTALGHERGGRMDEVRPEQLRALVPPGGSAHATVVRDHVTQSVADLMVATWASELSKTYGGSRGAAFGSVGKVRRSRVTKALAGTAMEALGAEGMLADGVWQSEFLTSPAVSIRGGTDEIQRNIIGERILGLPAEPRLDKDVPFSEIPKG